MLLGLIWMLYHDAHSMGKPQNQNGLPKNQSTSSALWNKGLGFRV